MTLLGTLRLLPHLQATPQKCSPLHTHTHRVSQSEHTQQRTFFHRTNIDFRPPGSEPYHHCTPAQHHQPYAKWRSHLTLDVRHCLQCQVTVAQILIIFLFFKLCVVLGVQLQVRISTIFELCAHSQIPLITIEFMQLACQDNLDHFVLRSASWV